MFDLVRIFRTSSLGDNTSRNPDRTALRRAWWEVRLCRSFVTKAGSLNTKRLLLTKENQISQVKEFSAFLCVEDARVWAHWNHSFPIYLNYSGPISCVLYNLSPLGLIMGSGYTVLLLMAGILLLPKCP